MARIHPPTLPYLSWKRAVDQVLVREYAITIEDAGLDEHQLLSHWEQRESPSAFVNWLGTKYDLLPLAAALN